MVGERNRASIFRKALMKPTKPMEFIYHQNENEIATIFLTIKECIVTKCYNRTGTLLTMRNSHFNAGASGYPQAFSVEV